jgi:predicted aldo/keto reductase-like oxidoreductase
MTTKANIAENIAIAETAHPNDLTAEDLALVDRAARKYHE